MRKARFIEKVVGGICMNQSACGLSLNLQCSRESVPQVFNEREKMKREG